MSICGGASSVAYITGGAGQGAGAGAGQETGSMEASEIDVQQVDGEVGGEEGRAIGERMLASALKLVPALKSAKVALVTCGHRVCVLSE